ncbi:MAG: protein phosphatase 2C domain-containing protein [Mycobacterium sp.]
MAEGHASTPRLSVTAGAGLRASPRRATNGMGCTAQSLKPRPAQYRLEFDGGSTIAVRGRGLIGRDPVAAADKNVEHLIALADETMTMSRTHLEFDIGESGLWVRDCASTNGSEIEVDGYRTAMEPGLPVHAPSGCTIHMGGRRVKVLTILSHSAIDPQINWGVATHTGAVRETNQDAYCTTPTVFAVADGVGGHSAGDIAAHETVEALSTLAGREEVTDEMVRACLADARARIGRIPVAHGQPPATTLSGVIATRLDDVPTWLIVNIGDSRTYRLNSDGLQQLSIDHSIVQELIDMHAIDPSEARSHPTRNVLTRALRADIEYPADVWGLPIIAGDRILVCSDGLTREVDDGFISRVLRAIPDPLAAANQLVKAAVDAGGHDNVTVLIIDATEVQRVNPATA